MQRKRKLLILIITVFIIGAVIGGILFFNTKNKNDLSNPFPQMNQLGEDIVMATGLTSTGMTEEECDLDFLETSLYVEEKYLSMGDQVEEGTPVFKISDESLNEAWEELNNAVEEADLGYRQGVITYEQEKLEAENAYSKAEINKEYAQAEYDSSLEETKQQVEDLAKQVEEAQELYEEYGAVVESDYYYTYYNIKKLKDTYYDNFTFLMNLYEEWDIEGLNDKYPNGAFSGNSSGGASDEERGELGGQASTQMPGGISGGMSGGGSQGNSDESSKLTVYEMMDELVQKNGEEYETAMESYEKETLMATASLDQAKSKLAVLRAELAEAQLTYEKQVIASKADYNTTIAESENAKSVYDTTINKIEEELEQLKDTKEEALNHLEEFESTIGDGYFYTKSSGIIVMNRVMEKNTLSVDSIILAYSDPATVTVEASVDQSKIAKVSVGDIAYAVINEYGNYSAVVTSMNPVSSSNSKSSVTYTVTIELEGDISNLESNLTAYVYIGMDEEQMQQMQGMGQENRKNNDEEVPPNHEEISKPIER